MFCQEELEVLGQGPLVGMHIHGPARLLPGVQSIGNGGCDVGLQESLVVASEGRGASARERKST